MPPTKADLEQRIVELQAELAKKESSKKIPCGLRKKLRAQTDQMKDGAETVKRMHYMDVGPKKTNGTGKEWADQGNCKYKVEHPSKKGKLVNCGKAATSYCYGCSSGQGQAKLHLCKQHQLYHVVDQVVVKHKEMMLTFGLDEDDEEDDEEEEEDEEEGDEDGEG